MFQGATQLNLDGKGRLAIPSRYRDVLQAHCAGRIVLTADPEGGLLLYPQPDWLPIKERLMNLPTFAPNVRPLQRLIVGHAEEMELDGAGRILISPLLRAHAALDKRVVLAGQGGKLEVWDEMRWQAQTEKALAIDFNNLPEGLGDFRL